MFTHGFVSVPVTHQKYLFLLYVNWVSRTISFEERDKQLKNNWKPVHQTESVCSLAPPGLGGDQAVLHATVQR